MTLKNSIYLLSNKRAIFILFFCWSLFSLAQSDSTSKLELHSPKKAAIYSAILPGLGQIYNKKYWKLPIVYGALGGTIYSITWNQTQYQRYRQERKYRFDNNTVQNIELQLLSDANLIELETYYKKWRDFSSIMTGLVYVLNIIDANVDAHLMTFDVSDDLSMNIIPQISIIEKTQYAGLALTLSF